MRKSRIGPILVIPAVAFLIIFTIYPLIYSLNTSFQSYQIGVEWERHYVGLANYIEVLTSPFTQFWLSWRITGIFALVVVSIEFLLGLGLALLLSEEIRGKNIIRSLIILPVATAPIIVGLIWRFMLNEEFGVINYLLSALGLPTRVWLGLPSTALPTVMIIDIWQWTPFMFLILLTGILGLPKEPFESADIDGASAWKKFRHITFPLMKPVILVAILFRTIDVLRIFDKIYVLTYGGPGYATEVFSMYTYKTGFKFSHMGKASAISWLFLIIMIIISNIYIRLLGRTEK